MTTLIFILMLASMLECFFLILQLRVLREWMTTWAWRWIIYGFFLLSSEILVALLITFLITSGLIRAVPVIGIFSFVFNIDNLSVLFSVLVFLKVTCYLIGFVKWNRDINGMWTLRIALKKALQEINNHETLK